jgi:SAM-dependent methyltransferase
MNRRKICRRLDRQGLWRLKGAIERTPEPWPLTDLQKKTLSDFLEAKNNGTIRFIDRQNCACGANSPLLFANIDRFGLQIDSLICQSCGLVYANPVLDSDSVHLFYQKYYHRMHFGISLLPDKTLYAKGQGTKIFQILRKWLDAKLIKVLEIGCGSGTVIKEFLQVASSEGFLTEGVGVEFSSEYVSRANPEDLNLKIISGRLDSLDPRFGPFDVVILSHVFEHFLDPSVELESLKKYIDDRSLIYIEVPGIFSLKYRYEYDCDYLKYFTFAHTYNFNLTALVNLLNLNGFALLWGNEQIESVFVIGSQSIDVTDNAIRVRIYLEDLEENRLFYLSLSTNALCDRLNEKYNIPMMKSEIYNIKSIFDSLFYFIPGPIRKYVKNCIQRRNGRK